MIVLKIDVTKLDKTRFQRVTNPDGTESVFCELVVIEAVPKPGKDYDVFVRQGVAKGERGKSVPILGFGKNFKYPRYNPRA